MILLNHTTRVLAKDIFFVVSSFLKHLMIPKRLEDAREPITSVYELSNDTLTGTYLVYFKFISFERGDIFKLKRFQIRLCLLWGK